MMDNPRRVAKEQNGRCGPKADEIMDEKAMRNLIAQVAPPPLPTPITPHY
jgi:hypothetical protein